MNKSYIIVTLALILAALLFLNKFKSKDVKIKPIKKPKKQTKQMDEKTKEIFFSELVKYIHRMEGGLTNDTSDPAAKRPSPTPEKYHTNKGVTWGVFVDSASSLGYKADVDTFIKMPPNVWLKIYKDKYYNKAKNFTNNEVLNAYLSLWFWGGWAFKHMPVKRVTDVIADQKTTNKEKLYKLVQLRKEYFDNIIKANKVLKKYERGWKNRADEFYNEFGKYL